MELRLGFFLHVFLISAFVLCSGFFVAVTTKERKQKKSLKVLANEKSPSFDRSEFILLCVI